jgi:hypothetical protein
VLSLLNGGNLCLLEIVEMLRVHGVLARVASLLSHLLYLLLLHRDLLGGEHAGVHRLALLLVMLS